MNVLIVGGASAVTRCFVDKLSKEGHRIFVLTNETKSENHYRKAFETYYFPYDNECVEDVMRSTRPEAVLFMGAYDRSFRWEKQERDASAFIAGLTNVLMAFSGLGKGRFIYLSSEQVFEGMNMRNIPEEAPCVFSSLRARAVAMGEKLCDNCRKMAGLDTIVVRLDHLYAIPADAWEADSLCARMCVEAMEVGEILADPTAEATMLYVSDAVELTYRLIISEEHRQSLYQIAASEPVGQMELAKMIQTELSGGINVVEKAGDGTVQSLSNAHYDEEFGIRIFHEPKETVPLIARRIQQHSAQFCKNERNLTQQRESVRKLMVKFLPFLENMVAFIPFFMLNNRAVGSQYFQRLDFYLLYVLLFAIVYGQQQAIFSVLLAVAGYSFRQMYTRSGFDILLDYNTYIWIAQLMILGLAVGYMRDQLRAGKEEQVHESHYLTGQIADMAAINASNVRVKEALSVELTNQTDSLGKLYEITSQLDRYQPEEVLFYAAEMLSKLLGSEDVAIYSVESSAYARLFSATSEKARCLGNSIRYSEMDKLQEPLKRREVYVNRSIDEGYPMMASAIYSGDEMQLILMVWGLPWQRVTLGEVNRLTVIGHLIQDAVLRARRYILALDEERHLACTDILEEDAFRRLARAYLAARERSLTQCALIAVQRGGLELGEISRRLKDLIRQSDYLGQLNSEVYVLLANTDTAGARTVCERIAAAGMDCRFHMEAAV